MNKPNDILLGLTRYLHPVVLFFLLLSVSHLVLPLLASLNSDSYIFERIPNHISFLYDWPYHLIWVGIIAPTIMLIYVFHGRTNNFVHGILGNYESSVSKFMGKVYVPVISLIIASGISFLIYEVNGSSYAKAGVTTWWLPNPGGKPALVTIIFHIWSAIIGSTAFVYVIHHLAVSINVQRLLGSWTDEVVENMEASQLLKKFNSMIKYFTSPVYVLLPGVILGCIVIVMRRAHLDVKFADPTVSITAALMAVGLFLLYLIPLLASGLASKIGFAKLIRRDVRESGLTIFSPQRGFWMAILAPVWSTIVTKVIERLT